MDKNKYEMEKLRKEIRKMGLSPEFEEKMIKETNKLIENDKDINKKGAN